MCSVSAVHDYGRNLPLSIWTEDSLAEFRKLIEQAKQFDIKTGQPDCEDPEKTKFIQVIEQKVDNG